MLHYMAGTPYELAIGSGSDSFGLNCWFLSAQLSAIDVNYMRVSEGALYILVVMKWRNRLPDSLLMWLC